MTLTAAPGVVAEPAEPRRRRWQAGTAALVVLVLAAIGAVALIRHYSAVHRYRSADALSCACGLYFPGPGAPGTKFRHIDVGPYSGDEITAYPGHVQSFEVLLFNESTVAQTAFGGRRDRETAEPEDVTFARPTVRPSDDAGSKAPSDFTDMSATIAPKGSRWVRVSIHTSNEVWKGAATKSRQEAWTELDLRVRVGSIIRREVVDFGNFAFVLKGA